jgi:hypothetical protein
MARTTRTPAAAPEKEQTKEKLELVVSEQIIDYGQDEGAGLEGADAQSFAIPFLTVVQRMSPICDEQDGEYNPLAKPGMIRNTATGELYDGKEGIHILICAFQRRFLRWAPRDAGGGFKGEITPEEAAELEGSGAVQQFEGKLLFPMKDGSLSIKTCDRLSDTRNHFCIVEANGSQALISLASTQIKKSKQLNAILTNIRFKREGKDIKPPSWAVRIHMSTVAESNEKGNWHGVKFVVDPEQPELRSLALYEAGKHFYKTIMAGTAAPVRYEDAQDAAPSDAF